MPLNPRAGRPRQAAVNAYRQACALNLAPCWLCDQPIDYTLDRGTHPLRFTVDEAHPISLGGSALDPTNYRPAHAVCNSSRGNSPPTPAIRAACRATYHRHATPRTTSAAW